VIRRTGSIALGEVSRGDRYHNAFALSTGAMALNPKFPKTGS